MKNFDWEILVPIFCTAFVVAGLTYFLVAAVGCVEQNSQQDCLEDMTKLQLGYHQDAHGDWVK